MDIQYLREFLQLAETENYTDAAELLFVSSSSLFKHIKQLEEELGVLLFEKRGRNIVLSEYGRLFLPYAEKITAFDSRSKKKIKSRLNQTEHRIKIFTDYHMADLAVHFHRSHEEYVLDIRQGSCIPRELKNLVSERAYDMYFLTDKSSVEDNLTCVPLIRERLVILAPEDHPAAVKSTVRMEEMKDYEFILFHDFGTKEGTYNVQNSLFRNMDYIPKSSIRVSRPFEMVKLVQKGFGLAVLSRRILEAKNYDGVRIIAVEPPSEYTVWCCYPKDTELSPGAELFLNFCRNEGLDEFWGEPSADGTSE